MDYQCFKSTPLDRGLPQRILSSTPGSFLRVRLK
jgi:hypothetical protein